MDGERQERGDNNAVDSSSLDWDDSEIPLPKHPRHSIVKHVNSFSLVSPNVPKIHPRPDPEIDLDELDEDGIRVAEENHLLPPPHQSTQKRTTSDRLTKQEMKEKLDKLNHDIEGVREKRKHLEKQHPSENGLQVPSSSASKNNEDAHALPRIPETEELHPPSPISNPTGTRIKRKNSVLQAVDVSTKWDRFKWWLVGLLSDGTPDLTRYQRVAHDYILKARVTKRFGANSQVFLCFWILVYLGSIVIYCVVDTRAEGNNTFYETEGWFDGDGYTEVMLQPRDSSLHLVQLILSSFGLFHVFLRMLAATTKSIREFTLDMWRDSIVNVVLFLWVLIPFSFDSKHSQTWTPTFFHCLNLRRAIIIMLTEGVSDSSSATVSSRRFELMVRFVSMLVCLVIVLIGMVERFGLHNGSDTAASTDPDLFDALWWVFVTITTIGYGEMYPNTWSSQCVALVIIVAIFAYGIPEALDTWELFREEQRAGGTYGGMFNGRPNHVVIAGGVIEKNNLDAIVEGLSTSFHKQTPPFVVILTEVQVSEELRLLYTTEYWKERIKLMVGSCLEKSDLERANVHGASAVILLTDPERTGQDADKMDSETILRAWSIREFAPVVAQYVQVILPENAVQLQNADDMIVSVGGVAMRNAVLANSCMVRGFSTLLLQILTQNYDLEHEIAALTEFQETQSEIVRVDKELEEIKIKKRNMKKDANYEQRRDVFETENGLTIHRCHLQVKEQRIANNVQYIRTCGNVLRRVRIDESKHFQLFRRAKFLELADFCLEIGFTILGVTLEAGKDGRLGGLRGDIKYSGEQVALYPGPEFVLHERDTLWYVSKLPEHEYEDLQNVVQHDIRKFSMDRFIPAHLHAANKGVEEIGRQYAAATSETTETPVSAKLRISERKKSRVYRPSSYFSTEGFDEELAHRESNREHEIVKQFLDAAKLDVYSEQFKANSLNVRTLVRSYRRGTLKDLVKEMKMTEWEFRRLEETLDDLMGSSLIDVLPKHFVHFESSPWKCWVKMQNSERAKMNEAAKLAVGLKCETCGQGISSEVTEHVIVLEQFLTKHNLIATREKLKTLGICNFEEFQLLCRTKDITPLFPTIEIEKIRAALHDDEDHSSSFRKVVRDMNLQDMDADQLAISVDEAIVIDMTGLDAGSSVDRDALYQMIRHLRQVRAGDRETEDKQKDRLHPIVILMNSRPPTKVCQFLSLFDKVWYTFEYSSRLSKLRNENVLRVLDRASTVLIVKQGKGQHSGAFNVCDSLAFTTSHRLLRTYPSLNIINELSITSNFRFSGQEQHAQITRGMHPAFPSSKRDRVKEKPWMYSYSYQSGGVVTDMLERVLLFQMYHQQINDPQSPGTLAANNYLSFVDQLLENKFHPTIIGSAVKEIRVTKRLLEDINQYSIDPGPIVNNHEAIAYQRIAKYMISKRKLLPIGFFRSAVIVADSRGLKQRRIDAAVMLNPSPKLRVKRGDGMYVIYASEMMDVGVYSKKKKRNVNNSSDSDINIKSEESVNDMTEELIIDDETMHDKQIIRLPRFGEINEVEA
eukprot:m.186964 g.186964  ORF g.186964 m.186964 type:complete len:1537 (+) comp32288_c0_seq1:222-4832(+)